MAMSVRQIKGSQCDLDWSTHALNEGVNLSGMLLCQQCQQDKPAPVMKKMRNVTDLRTIREDDYLHISTTRTIFFHGAGEPENLLTDLGSSCLRMFLWISVEL